MTTTLHAVDVRQIAHQITEAATALHAPGAGPYDRPARTEAGLAVLWRTAPVSGTFHGRGSYWSPARQIAEVLSVMQAARRYLASTGLYEVTATIPEHDAVPDEIPWGIWRLETPLGSVYRLRHGDVPDGPAGPLRTALDRRIRTGVWPGQRYRWLVFTEPAEDKIPANDQLVYLGRRQLTPILVNDGDETATGQKPAMQSPQRS